jgi:hypothetical protein
MSDDVAFIAGAPGTGKTTALAKIRDGYESAGYRVIWMGGTTLTEQNLRHRGVGNATTVAAELRRIATGLTHWDGRTVLIVDGTAVPSKHLTSVLGQASAKGAKVIIAGDSNQLASIECRGGGFGELVSGPPRSAPAVPPPGACFLLDLLLAKADRKTLLGCLEEEFTTYILPKYSARRARFWFWMQTVRTIAIRNPICRWLLVYGLARFGEWILRRIGS